MYGVASVIATATVLTLLGFVAVCLRFYVRIRIVRTFVGIDDWLIAISCFLILSQSACQIVGTILKLLLYDWNVEYYTRIKLTVVFALEAVIGQFGRGGELIVYWRHANQAQVCPCILER